MPEMAHFSFDQVFDADEYLHFYEDTLRSEDAPRQVDFMVREMGMAPGASILDLGCGHGRHSNELARRGYGVFAVDMVLGLLEKAREAARAEGLEVHYALGDVRGIGIAGGAHHAICVYDSFGYLDDAGNEAWLGAVAGALDPGGTLLLDLRNRDWVARSVLPVTVLDKGEDMMIDRYFLDTESGRLVDRRTQVRNGQARTVTYSMRLYTFSEISLMLRVAGFTVERAWGGWDGSPLSIGKNRMLVLARKS